MQIVDTHWNGLINMIIEGDIEMSRKDENAKQAATWLNMLKGNPTYSQAIDVAIKDTFVRDGELIYDDEFDYLREKAKVSTYKDNVIISEKTTYDAALELSGKVNNVCILNFASYFKPGGGFIKGAYTQEESLCHVSGLYPILSSLDVYEKRANNKSIPDEYRSEVIYSSCVPFTQEPGYLSMPVLFDVVSCAAPNCNRVPIARMEAVESAIDERLSACYLLPYLRGCDALVLGAWGCGVFRNNPIYIASTFQILNQQYGSLYKKIVYALPNDKIRETFSSLMKSECVH